MILCQLAKKKYSFDQEREKPNNKRWQGCKRKELLYPAIGETLVWLVWKSGQRSRKTQNMDEHVVQLFLSPGLCLKESKSATHRDTAHLDCTAAMPQAYLDAHQEMNEYPQSISAVKLWRSVNKKELLAKKASQRLPLCELVRESIGRRQKTALQREKQRGSAPETHEGNGRCRKQAEKAMRDTEKQAEHFQPGLAQGGETEATSRK